MMKGPTKEELAAKQALMDEHKDDGPHPIAGGSYKRTAGGKLKEVHRTLQPDEVEPEAAESPPAEDHSQES